MPWTGIHICASLYFGVAAFALQHRRLPRCHFGDLTRERVRSCGYEAPFEPALWSCLRIRSRTPLRTNMERLAAVSLLCHFTIVSAHGKLLCPKPRQYRDEGFGWTHWQGITVPGDGSLAPGDRNANNLNAAIGGGVANEHGAQPGSHGLCGDLGSRNIFTAPNFYGPTAPRGTGVVGGTMRVNALISAWHTGWLEFRLAVPADGGADYAVPITQSLLNEHMLEIADSTPDHPAILNYAHMRAYNNGQGGWYKCRRSGGNPRPTNDDPTAGHLDATSKTPQTVWPHGTCCNECVSADVFKS